MNRWLARVVVVACLIGTVANPLTVLGDIQARDHDTATAAPPSPSPAKAEAGKAEETLRQADPVLPRTGGDPVKAKKAAALERIREHLVTLPQATVEKFAALVRESDSPSRKAPAAEYLDLVVDALPALDSDPEKDKAKRKELKEALRAFLPVASELGLSPRKEIFDLADKLVKKKDDSDSKPTVDKNAPPKSDKERESLAKDLEQKIKELLAVKKAELGEVSKAIEDLFKKASEGAAKVASAVPDGGGAGGAEEGATPTGGSPSTPSDSGSPTSSPVSSRGSSLNDLPSRGPRSSSPSSVDSKFQPTTDSSSKPGSTADAEPKKVSSLLEDSEPTAPSKAGEVSSPVSEPPKVSEVASSPPPSAPPVSKGPSGPTSSLPVIAGGSPNPTEFPGSQPLPTVPPSLGALATSPLDASVFGPSLGSRPVAPSAPSFTYKRDVAYGQSQGGTIDAEIFSPVAALSGVAAAAVAAKNGAVGAPMTAQGKRPSGNLLQQFSLRGICKSPRGALIEVCPSQSHGAQGQGTI